MINQQFSLYCDECVNYPITLVDSTTTSLIYYLESSNGAVNTTIESVETLVSAKFTASLANCIPIYYFAG
jgi:hypothetical protein